MEPEGVILRALLSTGRGVFMVWRGAAGARQTPVRLDLRLELDLRASTL